MTDLMKTLSQSSSVINQHMGGESIYRLKRSGPDIDPCGTPTVDAVNEDSVLFTCTLHQVRLRMEEVTAHSFNKNNQTACCLTEQHAV